MRPELSIVSYYGSSLRFPFQPDPLRGTLATTSDPVEQVGQEILMLISTRCGERVMLPDFGIDDFVFTVMDVGFAARLEYHFTLQIRNYVRMVDELSIVVGQMNGGVFVQESNLDQQKIAVSISYTVLGSNAAGNLVFPIWQLRSQI